MKTKKRMRHIAFALCALLSLAWLGWLGTVPAGATAIQAASDPKKELDELEKLIDQNKDKAANQEKLAAVYSKQIQALDEEMDQLEDDIEVQQALKRDAEARLKKAEEELRQAEAQTKEYRDLMEQRMVQIYINGNFDYVGILIDSMDLQSAFQRLDALSHIMRFDQDLVDKLAASERLVQAKKDIIAEENARIQATLDRLIAAQAKLDAQLGEKSAMLNKARESKAYMEALVRQEEKDAAELRRLVEQSGAKGSYGNNFKALTWPLPGKTYVSSPCGWRIHPITGERSYHKGTDIPAASGTSILSPGAGKITAAGWSSSYGYYSILDMGKDPNGNTWKCLFAHQSKLLVSKGDTVKQGQVIGKVGSTGNSTGPHLHFELIINGDYKAAKSYITAK